MSTPESRLRKVLETSDIGTWELTIANQELVWSPAITRMYGLEGVAMPASTEDLLARLHPDDRQGLDQAFRRCIAGAGVFDCEYRVVLFDGTERRVRVHGRLTSDAAGKPEYLTGTSQDMTESLASQKILQDSESIFRRLADAIPQIVWTAQVDGGLDYYNERWCTYTGMSVEQTQGWGWGPVLHPDDPQNCIDRWTEAFMTGTPYDVQYRFKRASDGAYRWHLGRALPVRSPEGTIIKWFGTCTDIHDHKLAEAKAQAAEQQLHAILASTPMLLWATDLQGNMTLHEGHLATALGPKGGSLVGTSIYEAMIQDPVTTESACKALLGESFFTTQEFAGRLLETHYTPMRDELGDVVGMVAVSIDVSQRKETERAMMSEKAAHEAARLMGQFLANVSHELRTPMNGILGMNELLLESKLDHGKTSGRPQNREKNFQRVWGRRQADGGAAANS